MKIVRIFFSTVFILLCRVGFSQHAETQAQRITDKMKMDLVLTTEQANQVLPVNQTFVETLQLLRTSSDGKLAKYRKFNAADDKRDRALKAILTKEQFVLFKAQKKENRDLLKEARKNRGNG